MQNIFNIICVLFFLQQFFFGEGWAPVFCRLLVGGCVVYWLVCKYRLNKQEQEQAKLGKEQPAAHCLLANVIFGNYRLPIKIYYICSCTVDEKKRHAVGTVFLVAVGCFCAYKQCQSIDAKYEGQCSRGHENAEHSSRRATKAVAPAVT